MRIQIRVKPSAKKEKIIAQKDGSLCAWVKQPAKDGKANEAVREVIAKHFSVPKSAVEIVFGFKSARKIVEISSRKL